MRRDFARASCLLGLVALVACGGAPPPPAAKGGDESERAAGGAAGAPDREGGGKPGLDRAAIEPHIRDAAAEIERAQRALDDVLGPTKEGAKKKDAAPPAPPDRSADTPGPDKPRKAPGDEKASGAAPCDIACVALASMERAATYLCRLAGEGDPRCPAARGRVRAARDRVQAAACPCVGVEVPVSSAPSGPDPEPIACHTPAVSTLGTSAGE